MNDLQRFISLQDELLSTLSRVLASGEVLSDEYQSLIANQLEWLTQRISELSQPVQPSPDQQETIDLLWNIAGGDPQIFAQYAASFPDAGLQQLLRNPATMQQIVAQMSQQPPVPPSEIGAHGIPSASVYGFKYNPEDSSLIVQFNGDKIRSGGPKYRYENVPEEFVDIIARGDMAPLTTGANKWKSWTKGIKPSVGSAVNQLLVKGGFPYQKIQ